MCDIEIRRLTEEEKTSYMESLSVAEYATVTKSLGHLSALGHLPEATYQSFMQLNSLYGPPEVEVWSADQESYVIMNQINVAFEELDFDHRGFSEGAYWYYFFFCSTEYCNGVVTIIGNEDGIIVCPDIIHS